MSKPNKINSRSKGNRAERALAKELEEWTGKPFARTPSSGGLQWGSTFAKGDIICTKDGHFFPFCIEVKSYAEINLTELLVGRKKKPKVVEFWEQCTRDAKEAGKIPMLWMRHNGLKKGEWLVAIPLVTFNHLFHAQNQGAPMMYTWNNHFPNGLALLNSQAIWGSNYVALRKALKQNKKLLKRW